MEFRIADLLDAADASDVPIRPGTTVSRRRVEALVSQKIPPRRRQKPPARRPLRLAVLAAALILVLSLSIFAGASGLRAADLFGSFFGLLSPGQKDTMDEIQMLTGSELPISVTENGTTVTLQSAIGDDRSCYLVFQLQGPKDRHLYLPDSSRGVLDLFPKDNFERPDGDSLLRNSAGERLQYYYDLTWTDSDPGDHQLGLILELTLPMDSPVSFVDGEPELLTIPGLWLRTPSLEYTQLLEGPWTMELGSCGGQFRELDVSGKTAEYAADGTTGTVRLDSMKLSQLGLEIRGTFLHDAGSGAAYSYPTPMVVLKDQSVFPARLFTGDAGSRGNGVLNETGCAFSAKFDAPLDLSQVDHVRIGDLVIPFSEGESPLVDSSSFSADQFVLGTHITLGQPDSLRSSGTIPALEDIGVHGSGSVTPADWYNAWTYAAHTDEGVQLAYISSEFRSGKLVYTITDARAVTDLRGLGTKQDGFSYEACLALDENREWKKLERPACIREDGSFEDGWVLVLLDLTVASDQAARNAEDPYLFRADSLLTMADLRHKTVGNYRCFTVDYFSGLNGHSEHPFSFRLEPGERVSFTIGYLLHNPDYASLRACTTTGGEMSTFVNLDLAE